jgi:hypothetical protein
VWLSRVNDLTVGRSILADQELARIAAKYLLMAASSRFSSLKSPVLLPARVPQQQQQRNQKSLPSLRPAHPSMAANALSGF